MVRTLVCAVAGLILFAGALKADEIKGKVKEVNSEKMTLTVVGDDGKEHVVNIGKATRVVGPNGQDLHEGIKNKRIKEGTEVTIMTEMREGQHMATEVRVGHKKEKD
jgi:hypothetical protein